MREVVVAGVCRTPIGSFGGALKEVKAADLGKAVMAESLKRAGISADQLDEVIFGCVLQAGLGQNIARQAAILAGIPQEVTCMTINKVCGSGLRAVSLAAQTIKAGDSDVVLAGGTESMSQAIFGLDKARWGARMGDVKMVDLMIKDGLWEAFNNYHMGMTAENIVDQKGLTREEQDIFACRSQERATAAIASGRFKDEIVPVVIPGKKGDVVFDTDEYPKATTVEKLAGLKPAFKKDGSVTAGNASGINDGAAACVVMAKEKAEALGVKPIAKVVSYATGGVDPKVMGLGPIPAVQKALKIANLTIDDISLIEANEAFAAQALACGKELGFAEKLDILNVNGGAIALGHPIGSSGARIMTTLLYEMQKRELKGKYGLATLCIGGGMGIAVIFEAM